MVQKRWIFFGVWVVWMTLIFTFSTSSLSATHTQSWIETSLTTLLPDVHSLLSTNALHILNYGLRKLAHFSEYAILTTIGYLTWTQSFKQAPLQGVRFALAGAIAFAISDEFHQRFEAGRTSLVTDVMIDSLGATVAALIIFWILARSSSQWSSSTEETPN